MRNLSKRNIKGLAWAQTESESWNWDSDPGRLALGPNVSVAFTEKNGVSIDIEMDV